MTKIAMLAFAAGLGLASGFACLAATETTLHVFAPADGTSPESSLLPDGKGGFYGTAVGGGANQSGTIFHLTPPDATHAAWTTTMLHSLVPTEGQAPRDLSLGPDGSLYGTNYAGGHIGGEGSACYGGCGTIFRLAPPAPGSTEWVFSVIYTFRNNSTLPGKAPGSGLLVGSDSSLYGMTVYGGAYGGSTGYGQVFRLTPPAAGAMAWTLSVLHSFDDTHGAYPFGGLTGDPQTTIYGSTTFGGADCGVSSDGCGTVFQMQAPKSPGGTWTFTEIYGFQSLLDGDQPSPVTLGPDGVLYGTTNQGGNKSSYGQVFSLTPPAAPGGAWTKTELHAFHNIPDGQGPSSALALGTHGELYGNTYYGGAISPGADCPYGCGTVFRMKPPAVAGAPWHFATLHQFADGADGGFASNNQPILAGGTLYGLTTGGGTVCGVGGATDCSGTFYQVRP